MAPRHRRRPAQRAPNSLTASGPAKGQAPQVLIHRPCRAYAKRHTRKRRRISVAVSRLRRHRVHLVAHPAQLTVHAHARALSRAHSPHLLYLKALHLAQCYQPASPRLSRHPGLQSFAYQIAQFVHLLCAPQIGSASRESMLVDIACDVDSQMRPAVGSAPLNGSARPHLPNQIHWYPPGLAATARAALRRGSRDPRNQCAPDASDTAGQRRWHRSPTVSDETAVHTNILLSGRTTPSGRCGTQPYGSSLRPSSYWPTCSLRRAPPWRGVRCPSASAQSLYRRSASTQVPSSRSSQRWVESTRGDPTQHYRCLPAQASSRSAAPRLPRLLTDRRARTGPGRRAPTASLSLT